MNVLVLNGPGVAPGPLRHTLASLKAVLTPYYAVQTVSPEVLASDRWIRSCALLVFTGGRDLLYLSSLASSNDNIRNYVHRGGSFLGFCAGAYYASASVEWEIGRDAYEVKGPRPLAFFPGISRGCVFPGFEYGNDNGARVVSVVNANGRVYKGLYYNGGGEFVDTESYPETITTVRYDTDSSPRKVAGVSCKAGAGRASLWGVHLEYSLLLEPLRGLLEGVPHSAVAEWEEDRRSLLRDELQSLGLKIPDRSSSMYKRPLPQHLVASPELNGLVARTMSIISPQSGTESSWMLQDSRDTFQFHRADQGLAQSLVQSMMPIVDFIEPELDGLKHIIYHENTLPLQLETPLFDLSLFFSSLRDARSRRYLSAGSLNQWGAGELLLYGEAVTSTHSLLEQNPALLNGLPAPVVSLATHQMSGRGRGGNVWLSPPGQLMFSLLLRASHSKPNGALPYLPATRLVYVQYLVGIAIARACQSFLGEDGKKVRLKWPNDVYAVTNDNGTVVKSKLGGILVSTTFHEGNVSVLVGCGLNVFNEMPTTSLSAISPASAAALKMEVLAADVLSRIEFLWNQFLAVQGSFDSFMSDYIDCWLHSEEVVTIATSQPHTRVKIVGLTRDYGLLRTMPIDRPPGASNFIDLQPDGNSFDMMEGLIKAKT